MGTPAVRPGHTVIGAPAHPVRQPLGQLVLIGGCPPAVDFKPLVGGGDCLSDVLGHGLSFSPMRTRRATYSWAKAITSATS